MNGCVSPSGAEDSRGCRDRIVTRQSDSPELYLAVQLNGESDRLKGAAVHQITGNPPPRTTVRKVIDADHGPVWRVTFACGCPYTNRLTWHVAMAFATRHRCPKPYDNSGLMCMDHMLDGWPQDRDCPCIEPMRQRLLRERGL